MPVAVTILVLALFAGGSGAPSVCAALCASAPAEAAPPQAGGHHEHHAGHVAVPDTAVSATPCVEYAATAQVGRAPRPQETVAGIAVVPIYGVVAAPAPAALPVVSAASPPPASPFPDPPLRI